MTSMKRPEPALNILVKADSGMGASFVGPWTLYMDEVTTSEQDQIRSADFLQRFVVLNIPSKPVPQAKL